MTPRVIVVGGGFAGLPALRSLQRRLPRGSAELVLVDPYDYLLASAQATAVSGTPGERSAG